MFVCCAMPLANSRYTLTGTVKIIDHCHSNWPVWINSLTSNPSLTPFYGFIKQKRSSIPQLLDLPTDHTKRYRPILLHGHQSSWQRNQSSRSYCQPQWSVQQSSNSTRTRSTSYGRWNSIIGVQRKWHTRSQSKYSNKCSDSQFRWLDAVNRQRLYRIYILIHNCQYYFHEFIHVVGNTVELASWIWRNPTKCHIRSSQSIDSASHPRRRFRSLHLSENIARRNCNTGLCRRYIQA